MNQPNLRKKAIELINFFEEKFYDPQGLVYSALDLATLRPFPPDSVAHYPLNDFENKPAIADWLAYENTGMAAGAYLSALCHKAQVSPADQVYPNIQRVFDCIHKIYDLSSTKKSPGFFCKPWGGKATDETTVDQYHAVIAGLRELALLTDHPLSEKARETAVSLVDWWINHDYICQVWGGKGKVVERLPWAFTCMAFVRIAYELSGKKKYAIESERLCEKYNSDQPMPRSGAYIRNYYPDKPYLGIRRMAAFHHTVVDGLNILCETWPERCSHWRSLLKRFWEQDVNMGIGPDGIAYACYLVDERTNQWSIPAPGFAYPPGIDPKTYPLPSHFWVGGMKSGSLSCMILVSTVMTGNRVPELTDECRKTAAQLLDAMTLAKMTFIIDDEGGQENEKLFGSIRKRLLDGRCPASWLRAYWQGRQIGWW